jgi:hypothetical protein
MAKHKLTPYDLTTIDVQGSEQEVLEVYSSPAKEMTLGFVFDEDDAYILSHGKELVKAMREAQTALFKKSSQEARNILRKALAIVREVKIV